jgi:hypothetical protein
MKVLKLDQFADWHLNRYHIFWKIKYTSIYFYDLLLRKISCANEEELREILSQSGVK